MTSRYVPRIDLGFRHKFYAMRARVLLRARCHLLRLKCIGKTRHFDPKSPGSAPIFIVGCGHSGTSFLLAVLGSHSKMCPIPEETKLAYNYDTNHAEFHPAARQLIRYFNLLTISEGKARWIEKTPKHIFSIAVLRRRFPNARFLLMLRDGRDVACSLEKRWGSIEHGIQRWIEDNRAGEPYWNDPDVHIVKYETLVEEFEGTVRGILEFLGEDFEEAVLRSDEKPKYFYSKKLDKPPDETSANHDQYRNWQINQKLFDGRGKWKKLTDEKKDLIKRKAGQMLIDYGYTTDLKW